MSENRYAFWMVWNKNGDAPTVEHDSQATATAEAERLARLNPGQEFVVLQAVVARKMNDMHCVEYDDIPF